MGRLRKANVLSARKEFIIVSGGNWNEGWPAGLGGKERDKNDAMKECRYPPRVFSGQIAEVAIGCPIVFTFHQSLSASRNALGETLVT